ncbi:pyridoxamine 5'-phosphate oxidase family protein [Tissierella sp.]|uniref:pyridoxamine 5'-phosphate oxidase family protein n=1 Tax=Tissierella sp. TaxID=41274 RepID=UPI0028638C04|nr:pyridoxamine 5'-phosphate oxidase family protein [Tissierella sp.]MDR7857902.1 pyridoxamine 5'-phosphate oxidase family protein [Tissierella sp.]
MKSLDYEVLKQDVINALENRKSIVLATCSNNRVTAREVYFASNDFRIFFVTSKAFDKCKQIKKNNNVALCLGNIQMEGTAIIKGHPNLTENINEKTICLNKNKEEFEKYFKYKNTVLIEVEVCNVKLWNNGGREYLDINKHEAYRIG